jgi:hypothetical protein
MHPKVYTYPENTTPAYLQYHHKKKFIKVIGQFNDTVTELVRDFAKTYAYRLRRDQGKSGIKVAREGMTQILPVSQTSRYRDGGEWRHRMLGVQLGIIINTAGETHGNPECDCGCGA